MNPSLLSTSVLAGRAQPSSPVLIVPLVVTLVNVNTVFSSKIKQTRVKREMTASLDLGTIPASVSVRNERNNDRFYIKHLFPQADSLVLKMKYFDLNPFIKMFILFYFK